MEVFDGVDFVRLRSMQHGGAYVHAAQDGRSVRLDRTRASYNAVWAVQRPLPASGSPHVLLRGAYGRYLGAPDASTRGSLCPFAPPCRVAAQRDFDESEVLAIMWRAVATGRWSRGRGVFLLHDASGRYLRANSRCLLPCRSGVSVSSCSSLGKAVQWAVEAVPRSSMPNLPIARDSEWFKLFALVCPPLSRLCARWSSLEREVRWVQADAVSGVFSEDYWASLRYTGRATILLKGQVVRMLDPPASAFSCTLCVRDGRYGQPSPLVINLPRSREPLDVVIFRVDLGSRAHDELMFPDVNAEEMPAPAHHDDDDLLL